MNCGASEAKKLTMRTTLLICGKAGQGIQTIGYIISKLFVKSGYDIFAWQDFQSRIRGGETSFRIVVSDGKVRSLPESFDIIVSLDKENTKFYLPLLKKEGIAIYQGATDKNVISPPIEELSEKAGGSKFYANMVLTGIIAEVVCGELSLVNNIIKREFEDKSEDVVSANINAAKLGYEWSLKNNVKKFCKITPKKSDGEKMLISGNEAIALGAIAGGCKFISAYPMTPSSGIITYLSKTSDKTGILAEQAEDEISAVNMAIGASYAGARAMTSTSGGGFSLMVEGLSLAGMTEIPLVIVLAQRPGPATGLPTRTEQGDLLFALHAGHGEFPRFIFAPTSADDAYKLMLKAFDMSQKYRVPVIILSDQYLADSYWTLNNFDVNAIALTDYYAQTQKNFMSYKITDSGISAGMKPGSSENLVTADSDEHDESGHITEVLAIRKKMNEKRWRKFKLMEKEISHPKISPSKDPQIILVAWGTNSLIVEEAAEKLSQSGIESVAVSYSELWPLRVPEALMNVDSMIFAVENNLTGQFANLLKTKGVKIAGIISKYDGEPFTSEQIAEAVRKKL